MKLNDSFNDEVQSNYIDSTQSTSGGLNEDRKPTASLPNFPLDRFSSSYFASGAANTGTQTIQWSKPLKDEFQDDFKSTKCGDKFEDDRKPKVLPNFPQDSSSSFWNFASGLANTGTQSMKLDEPLKVEHEGNIRPFYIADCGMEFTGPEDTKPSELPSFSPVSYSSHHNVLSDLTNTRGKNVGLDEPFNFILQHNTRPSGIKSNTEDYSPMKKISVKSENDMPEHPFVSEEAEPTMEKRQKVMKVVDFILKVANNAKSKEAKWENIVILKEEPLRKNITTCIVNFSSAHNPAQITITENPDEYIQVAITDLPGTEAGQSLQAAFSSSSLSIVNTSSGLSVTGSPFDVIQPAVPDNIVSLEKGACGITADNVENRQEDLHQFIQCLRCTTCFKSREELKLHFVSKHGEVSCFPDTSTVTEPKVVSPKVVPHDALPKVGPPVVPPEAVSPKCVSQNQCNICRRCFTSPAELRVHSISKHAIYQCLQCNLWFKEEWLQAHFSLCSQQNQGVVQKQDYFPEVIPSALHQCHICMRDFNSQSKLNLHNFLTKHGPTLHQKDVKANAQKSITKHGSTTHQNITKHGTTTHQNISKHGTTTHQKVLDPPVHQNIITRYSPLNQCPSCRRLFSSPSELQLHTNSKHGYTIHQCQICSRWSDKQEWLRAHSAICAQRKENVQKKGKDELKIEISEDASTAISESKRLQQTMNIPFNTVQELEIKPDISTRSSVINYEHDKVDDVCPDSKSRQMQARHKIYIQPHQFNCSGCGKFHSLDDFHGHLASFGLSVPYKCCICVGEVRCTDIHMKNCLLCGKLFSAPCHLRNHLSLHTGLYKHSCVVCHKGFTSHFVLMRHMSNCHPSAKFNAER